MIMGESEDLKDLLKKQNKLLEQILKQQQETNEKLDDVVGRLERIGGSTNILG